MTRTPQTLVGVLLVLAVTSAGFAARHAAATRQTSAKSTTSQTQVTFNRDIAPIIFGVARSAIIRVRRGLSRF